MDIQDYKFWLVCIGIPTVVLFVVCRVLYPALKPSFVRSHILKNGFTAQGVVRDIEETGIYFNQYPQARVLISYMGTDGFEQLTTATLFIGLTRSLHSGATVKVMVDKLDTTRCVII